MKESRLWFRESNQKWYTTIAGRQVCLGASKKDAEKKHRELLARNVTTDPPVYQLFNRFLAFVEANRAEDTYIKYQRHLKPFGTLGRSLRVSGLQPHHVQRILDANYRGASTTTHNDVITVVKVALNWGVGQGFIAFNPLAKMPKPTRNVRETFVPASEWPSLLGAASSSQFRDYLMFALSTGARPQEIRKIEAGYFDRAARRIVFPRLKSKGKKHQRVIYLDDVALALVERLAAENEGLIFRNSRGRPWTKNAISCCFRALNKKLKIKICATVLRHSYAHNKLVEKTDSLVVSKLLGHRDGQMLATRYGHIEESDILASAARKGSPLVVPPVPVDPVQSNCPSQLV